MNDREHDRVEGAIKKLLEPSSPPQRTGYPCILPEAAATLACLGKMRGKTSGDHRADRDGK